MKRGKTARSRGEFSRWAVTSAIAAVLILCLTVVANHSLRIGNLAAARAVAAQRPAAPGPEITTPFYRIYTGGMRVASSRGVVRVKVPRATLAVFGLPFNPRRADAPITADLLVDNIGMVTAVRFVQ